MTIDASSSAHAVAFLQFIDGYNLCQNINLVEIDYIEADQLDSRMYNAQLQQQVPMLNAKVAGLLSTFLIPDIPIKHPYLDKLILDLHDNVHLESFLAVSFFLGTKRDDILKKSNIKQIVMKWDRSYVSRRHEPTPVRQLAPFIRFNEDIDYDSLVNTCEKNEKLEIEWDTDLKIDSCAIMYQNLLALFQKLYDKSQDFFDSRTTNTRLIEKNVILKCNLVQKESNHK